MGFLLLLSVFKRQYVTLDTSLAQKELSNLSVLQNLNVPS